MSFCGGLALNNYDSLRVIDRWHVERVSYGMMRVRTVIR